MNREQLTGLLGFAPSDEQWAAISAPLDGPMLVLAGAGSGKTAVMSARVVWLVASGLVAADQVLGLTFTNKAAGELSSRIRALLALLREPGQDDIAEPTISTYHAFAMDLLSQWALLIGGEPSAALLTPTDLAVDTYRAVARSHVSCEDLGTATISTVSERVQSLDEELSEHLITPQDLRTHDARLIEALQAETGADARDAIVAARRRILISHVVEEVRADRAAKGVVSFADLMRLAVLVTQTPPVREQMRQRYAVVLVDEYQDTSVAQRLMLQNLYGQGHPLTAVGDPLQAIYGWRGASVANIDGFPEHFGSGGVTARTSTLSINRRSGSLILDVANEVASDVRSQHPGVQILRPGTEAAGEVTAALFDTWADELDWLVAQVLAQIHQGRSLDQIAVLCRTNDYVRMVGQALRDAGIPTAAASLGSVLHLPEVVEVLSLLRVLETADNGALVRLLTGPQWRIGPSDLALLGARARELVGSSDDGEPDFQQALQQAVADVDPVDVVSLLEAVYDPGPAIRDEARSRLREFTAELDAMRPALAAGVEEAAHRVVEISGLGVEVRLGPNAASRIDGLAALFDVIAGYRNAHDDPSVGAFLRWLNFAIRLDETPDTDFPIRGDAVRVMTVHRAKGLEWECVFTPALSDGVFPSSQGRSVWTRNYKCLPYPLRGDRSRLPALPGWSSAGGAFPNGFKSAAADLKMQYKQQDAWEENRLAYVALTRARDVLFTSGHWWSASSSKPRTPSPYLLAVRDVPGVLMDTWVEEPSPTPPVLDAGDVDWPRPDEVFVSVAAPEGVDESLTLAESARLDRMDADIEAVIAREYEQSLPTTQVDLPPVVSTSLLMRAASDPQSMALDLARPMPYVTPDAARRGTAFHEWVAASHEQLSLLPDWDLAVDAERAGDDELAELIEGYRRTVYSEMVPVHTETEVSVRIAGLVVRGVIDAVFQHPDGTWEVVDWKTNREQTADPVQLAIYRVGWAQRVGVEPDEVLTAFVYVRDGEVVRPALPSIEDIASRVGAVSAVVSGGSQ